MSINHRAARSSCASISACRDSQSEKSSCCKVFRKLDVTNRSEAISVALRKQLLKI